MGKKNSAANGEDSLESLFFQTFPNKGEGELLLSASLSHCSPACRLKWLLRPSNEPRARLLLYYTHTSIISCQTAAPSSDCGVSVFLCHLKHIKLHYSMNLFPVNTLFWFLGTKRNELLVTEDNTRDRQICMVGADD